MFSGVFAFSGDYNLRTAITEPIIDRIEWIIESIEPKFSNGNFSNGNFRTDIFRSTGFAKNKSAGGIWGKKRSAGPRDLQEYFRPAGFRKDKFGQPAGFGKFGRSAGFVEKFWGGGIR